MFFNFEFQICLPSFKTTMLTVHIQCFLRVDGSILAGVFLISSFCVVPESSYSSNAASSSLLVAWYSNCSSAASSTKSTIASFKTSSLEEAAAESDVAQLHRSLFFALDDNTHCQTVAVMVSYDSILCDLCGESLQRVFE